jgi:signal peptidase I
VPDTDKKPDPKEGKKKKKKKKHKGRELVECLLVAGALALTIRTFGFQLFKIPTRSMEPTLYGNEYYGDRVVAMMWYNRGSWGLKLGEIRRWQVLVFNHKDEHGRPIHYIKRVVGLPNEFVEIRDGDVWINGELARKPRALQADLWIKLCDMTFSDARRLPYYWEVRAAAPLKKDEVLSMVKDGKLVLAPGKRERLTLQWCPARPIDNRFIRTTVKRLRPEQTPCGHSFRAVFDTARPLAFCPDPKCKDPVWGVRDSGGQGVLIRDSHKTRSRSNYWTEHLDGGSKVPDMRLALDFGEVAGSGKLEAVLTCRSERLSLELPLGAGETEVRMFREQGGNSRELVGSRKMNLTPAGPHHLEWVNVDGELRAELDGVEIGTHKYTPPAPGDSDAEIVVSGDVRLAVDNLRLYRDVYYGYTSDQAYRDWKETKVGRKSAGMLIPRGCYFFLGDNSLASQDGRVFGPKSEEQIVARGIFIAWPPSRMKWLK